jgi:hypothetical protein
LAGAEACLAAIPCSYSVEIVQHECGFPFPDSVTMGEGIADSGLVCGWWQDCVGTNGHGFLWPPGGDIQTIPYPPGIIHMKALDIAANGQWVAGEMDYADRGFRAFLRSADGTVLDLGVPVGGSFSRAHAVSSSGVVVGEWSGLSSGGAFRWERGVMTDLTPILGQALSFAYGIADNGLITGWAGADISKARAFILDGDRVTYLSPPAGAASCQGLAISSAGDVVGRFTTTAVHAWAYLDGASITLPELPGAAGSRANDLNDDQVIVEYCVGKDIGQRAAIWIEREIFDLNDLVPNGDIVLNEARAISSHGCITVSATEPTRGGAVAVLLTPIWSRFADLNCDRVVNGVDVELLLGQWGPCRDTSCSPDLTDDGIVNGFDLATLLAEWG